MEHDFEPVRGLPADLPEGETILWQGEPDWWIMAQRVFQVQLVAAWFALLLAWRLGGAVAGGASLAEAIGAALWVLPLAVLALGLLVALAAINARTTVYTITNKRVVMRFGAALTKAFNIPFQIIEGASLKADTAGAGDLAIQMKPPAKIAYLLLWPHARPGKLSRPEPSLRCLRDAAAVAPILAEALRKAHGQTHATPPEAAAAPSVSTGPAQTGPAQTGSGPTGSQPAGLGPTPAMA
jgi:Bacterial PH domain